MPERLDELEHRLTFQDHAIEELNQALIGQQRQVDALRIELDRLNARLAALGEPQVGGRHDEKPPHY